MLLLGFVFRSIAAISFMAASEFNRWWPVMGRPGGHTTLAGCYNRICVVLLYVTGSTKTVLIAQDRKFDFFTQTQSLMNALSSFTATVDQSKVVCYCWLLF